LWFVVIKQVFTSAIYLISSFSSWTGTCKYYVLSQYHSIHHSIFLVQYFFCLQQKNEGPVETGPVSHEKNSITATVLMIQGW